MQSIPGFVTTCSHLCIVCTGENLSGRHSFWQLIRALEAIPWQPQLPGQVLQHCLHRFGLSCVLWQFHHICMMLQTRLAGREGTDGLDQITLRKVMRVAVHLVQVSNPVQRVAQVHPILGFPAFDQRCLHWRTMPPDTRSQHRKHVPGECLVAKCSVFVPQPRNIPATMMCWWGDTPASLRSSYACTHSCAELYLDCRSPSQCIQVN